MQKHIERFCVDLHQRFLLGNHFFVDKVASDLDSGGGGALAVTGLEHVQLALLDSELHVLHVAVMVFERVANLQELLVNVGKNFRHFGNGHRRANACNDVFALRVHKELAHKTFFARGGVTRERNARAAIVAHVAESHHLDVDCRAPRIRNVVVHAVNVCAGVVPRTENGFDSLEQLFFRVVGELFAELIFVFRFKLMSKSFKVVRSQVHVELHALFFLHLVDEFFKVFFADFHNNVREHLDKTAVAVPRPTGVARLGGNGIYNVLVKTEVENGVHHAGHGRSRAASHGNKQRILFVSELFAADLLHLVDVGHYFFLNIVVYFTTVFIVLGARLGGNSEALGYGQADVSHFGEVRALAAQKLAHFGVTFGKKITVLFCHCFYSP